MAGRIWHIIGAAAAAAMLSLPAAADTQVTTVASLTPIAAEVGVGQTLRPHMASLIVSAQDKLREADILGAITVLDSAMTQRPTALERGITLTVRGGALYAHGDLDGALADWSRALSEGALDEATQLHLAHNIEQLQGAMFTR